MYIHIYKIDMDIYIYIYIYIEYSKLNFTFLSREYVKQIQDYSNL